MLILIDMMNIYNKITEASQKHALLKTNQTIILGLSGGPDSVFLLHYLISRKQELNLTLIAAHLNHQWRSCADQDEAFCKALCAQLNVTYISCKLSELKYRPTSTGSKEQDARNARRFFFDQLAQKYKADSIALAHHKNDQEETFFIRLLRGATITGLSAMWPQHGLYIRPLLAISKDDILVWLNKQNIKYITDPTNASSDYLRNRIRNELMPLLSFIDTRADINISKSIDHIQQTELFLQKLTSQAFATVATYDTTTQYYVVDIAMLLTQDMFMQYRLLMHWLTLEKVTLPASTSFLNEIVRFLKQPGSKAHTIHNTWSIMKHKKHCYVEKKHA